jgi:hypothetical protein
VSLAIYMHGITKEVHNLVRASRAFDAGPDGAIPFTADQTEWSYFEALRGLARADRWLSVTVDVIAETSVGGIDGVALGKALAVDGSQDGLKQVWIEEGDLRHLLRGLRVGGMRLRIALAVARLLVT